MKAEGNGQSARGSGGATATTRARKRPAIGPQIIECRDPLRIAYRGFCDEHERVAMQLVDAWIFLAPSWLTELVVFYEHTPDIENAAATSECRHEYRQAYIGLTHRFFEAGREDRELHETFVHELVHLLLSPFETASADIAQQVIDDQESALSRLVVEQLRRSKEAVVCEVTEKILLWNTCAELNR